jgi:TetR/AcrR family transcriptional regulator
MASSSPAPAKRRVGRPRKLPEATSEVAPRAQILTAAAELFAARGIAEVSMLEIARKSGLGQSSLYYWYRRKEQIVAELLQQVNRLPLAFARQLESEGDGADVQLFRLVQFDVRTVCGFPLEITEVHRFSRRDKPAFETYWRERRELTAAIEALVARGIESGCFRQVDARLCALTIIAQDESVQNWYLREPRPRREVGAPSYRAEQVAEFVATQTLGGLLASPARLSQLQRRAARNAG